MTKADSTENCEVGWLPDAEGPGHQRGGWAAFCRACTEWVSPATRGRPTDALRDAEAHEREKHSVYTPTTEELRDYIEGGGDIGGWGSLSADQEAARASAFDRWLAEHDREVAERVWAESRFDLEAMNPYRRAVSDDAGNDRG